jgi:uncharacterized protein (TIGR03382 family)
VPRRAALLCPALPTNLGDDARLPSFLGEPVTLAPGLHCRLARCDMRLLLPALLVSASLLALPRPSEACSCPPRQLDTFPADGAVDVAIDVVLMARLPTEAYRLVQGETEVSIAVDTNDGLTEIRPAVLLAPDTAYELFDGANRVVGFTTGDQAAPLPGEPAVAEFRVRGAPLDGWNHSCISGTSAGFIDLALVADPRAALYSVRRSDGYTQWFDIDEVAASGERYLDNGGLGAMLAIREDTLCFEIAARGANGVLGPPARHCAVVEACAPVSGAVETLTCEPPVLPPDGSDTVDDRDGGCSAVGGAGGTWLALLALVGLRRRRRGAASAG